MGRADYAIGIDVGGTRIKIAPVARDGRLLSSQSAAPTQPTGGPEALLASVIAQVRRVRDEFGEPVGVGLSLSGVVNPEVGVVYLPGKVEGLEGFPIVHRLRTATGLGVWADNDGRLAMVAERRFGAARDEAIESAVTLTIGTGIGSGVMLGGRVLIDRSFLLGCQVGHSIIQNYGGKLCLTTARGTAETLCSCTALAMSVRDGLQRGIPSSLGSLYWKNAHAVDFQAVIEAVRAGDRLCVDEFDRWVHNLGCLCATAVHAYAAELIILGGGGSLAADLYLSRLQDVLDHQTFRYPADRRIPVIQSKLTESVGVIGAAAMAFDRAGGVSD